MGNNATRTNLTANGTDDGGNQNKATVIPKYREKQPDAAIMAELGTALSLNVAVFVLNLMLIILIQRKLSSIPYLMIQNIAVIDLMTSLINGILLYVGLFLDPVGIALPSICNIQGFFHNSFTTAFVNTVTLVAASRCLLYHSPSIYRAIFVNKAVFRIVLLALWASSGLLAAAPLNYGLLGSYQRFEATCWLAWETKDMAGLSYNFILTCATLGTAITLTAFAIVSTFRNSAITPEPIASTAAAATKGLPSSTPPINTAILKITSAQLLIYIIIWLPLTVLDSLFLQNILLVDLPVTFTFLFLFFARGLFNPIICFVFSPDLSCQAHKMFCLCGCKADGEIPLTA